MSEFTIAVEIFGIVAGNVRFMEEKVFHFATVSVACVEGARSTPPQARIDSLSVLLSSLPFVSVFLAFFRAPGM